MTTTATKTTRRTAKITTCTIIARYAFKTTKQLNGTVCSVVVNGDGKEHKVWTHRNGCASHCDCDGFEKSHGKRKCYHIKHVEAVESKRPVVATPKPLISNEEMAAIAAAAHQAVDETSAAVEPARDLVAVAATNAAQAGPAIDKALIASTAQSDQRLASTLNGNRSGYVLPAAITAPVIAVSRVPMR